MKEKITGGSQYVRYGKTHYERNKQLYIDKSQRRRQGNTEYIRNIKRQSKCVDCGFGDWRCLDFDHLPKYEKSATIGGTRVMHWSRKRIDAEIAKCEVRCANCHRIKTLERAGVESR